MTRRRRGPGRCTPRATRTDQAAKHGHHEDNPKVIAATFLTSLADLDRFAWCDCPADFQPARGGFAVLTRWHDPDCAVLLAVKRNGGRR